MKFEPITMRLVMKVKGAWRLRLAAWLLRGYKVTVYEDDES